MRKGARNVALLIVAVALLAGCQGALQVTTAPELGANVPDLGAAGGLYALWGNNYQPIAGTAGTVIYYGWDEIEPADDAYNTARIDSILAVNDKVQLQILHHTTDAHDGALWWDRTPGWVNVPTIKLTSGSLTASVPDYRSSAWRNALLDMVADLGAYYDGHPKIGSIIVAAGLDGETQIVKAQGADWLPVLNTQASGTEYRFGQFLPTLMDAYRAAFPHTLLVLNNAPGSGRMQRAELAVSKGIGLKHAGMLPDVDFARGNDDALWEFMARYCNGAGLEPGAPRANCWVESATGNGNAEWMRWSAYQGLHYHPVGMSLHKSWFSPSGLGADELAWIAAHLNVTAATAPSAWTVLRDAEYEPYGAHGNWEQYLRAEGGTRVLRSDLPAGIDRNDWRARQSRRVEGDLALTADPAFACAPCTVRVNLAGTGGQIGVGGQAAPQTALAVPSDGQWHTLITTTSSIPANITANGHYIQMIELAPYVQDVTKTATICTPTFTATTYPTVTPRPTATLTPTPVSVALQNGGFEGGTYLWTDPWGNRIAEVTLPNGWQYFSFRPYEGDGYYHRPETKPEDAGRYGFRRVLDGWWGWKAFSTYSNHAYALGQRVSVPRGTLIEAGAYGQAWSSAKDDPTYSSQGSYWLNVGIDPAGGDDWQSANIVWAQALPGRKQLDTWARLAVTTTAQADYVTVWLRGEAEWRLKHNDSYWDAAWLRAVGAQPEPTWPPTVTPTVGASVTLAPTQTATPTATVRATATVGTVVTVAPTSTPQPSVTLSIPERLRNVRDDLDAILGDMGH
jgi:hypothetical protein